MSDSCLIHWIEHLLFGLPASTTSLPDPPDGLKNLLLRMEAENIPWSHILFHGGFTAFPYQIHGDLNYLTDHLEKQWLLQIPSHAPLQTRAVTKFWNELQLLLAKRDEIPPPALPAPPLRDDAILQDMLEPGYHGPYTFQSATFWGEVAHRLLQLRRPETVSPLPPASSESLKRVLQLYDITCVARGQYWDPLTMVLVHHAEYVNAAHWQTPKTLEAFMWDRPTHPLTRSIQALLKQTVEDVLHGEKPAAFLNPCPRLDALLYNIRVVHESIQQVPHDNAPPKLIDIFQRLLALSYRDGLWEKVVPVIEPTHTYIGTSLLYLTEQVRIAERERRLLWKQIIQHDAASDPEPPQHICSAYLYASDKHRASSGGRACQTFQC